MYASHMPRYAATAACTAAASGLAGVDDGVRNEIVGLGVGSRDSSELQLVNPSAATSITRGVTRRLSEPIDRPPAAIPDTFLEPVR